MSTTLEILTSQALEGVAHGFFTRKGGASSGVFSGLNCGHGSSDLTGAVDVNRARVAAAMGVAPERLIGVHQIHSPDVATGQGTDRQIELRLDPVELGAVSILLQGSEDALVVRITAERPDTLDLMRRNSDQLLAELRAAGIGDAQMSFDMGRDPSHTNRSAAEAAIMDALEEMPPGPVASMLRSAPIPAGDTGLFIRV